MTFGTLAQKSIRPPAPSTPRGGYGREGVTGLLGLRLGAPSCWGKENLGLAVGEAVGHGHQACPDSLNPMKSAIASRARLAEARE